MSTTIDERVVEMRFDNKQFESNVSTSMSTLDKLKQKLNLSGASKGLEDINTASKKVNMSGLGNSVEAVSAKFSAMQVIGITALSNITNSAVDAGKRIVSALTIDPVKTGFQEYETQINAVQTILANTSSKGTTIDQVNSALDELNRYADLTIYNFTEMTRNIGTFTAAGIDLETSVSAIQGIANLAAVSGSNSQQASTAMYQLSQALATGTVKLMDWNSVVNAGMGGEVFQNALKETSRLLGTGADAAIEASGSFRESLSDGWLTAEVLTETLKKFTTSGAAEYLSKFTGLSQETVDATLKATDAWGDEADAIDKAAEALANKSGKNKDEIKAALQMAKNAEDAATKVKTFTQLWDVLKESAQSGWSSTWKIIIGDFEDAKALLTPLADTLTGFINKMSAWRNNILQGALDFSKPWDSIKEKINGVVKPINKTVDAVSKVTEAVTDLDDIVNKVIHGDFGNGKDRITALTEAGINYYKVQNKVNEVLGNSFRYSEKNIETQDHLFNSQEKTTQATNQTTKATEKAVEAYSKLSDEQLKQAGLTEDEISLYRALDKEANRLGMSVSDLSKEMSENDGRSLLIDSFKNAGDGIVGVAKAIKEAWVDVFNPPGVGELAIKLYGAIKSLNEFSEKLRLTDKDTGKLNETGKKLQRTFKGIFAIVDIVTTVLGGGLKIAFKAISQILSYFDLNILDVTAAIGDALVKFHDWFESIFDISGALNSVVPIIKSVITTIKEWFSAFKETSAVQKFIKAIESVKKAFKQLRSGEINLSEFASNLGKGLANAVKSLPGIALQIGKDFIAGFQNGIGDGISGVINKIVSFCTNFIDSFKETLGVHSPSWKAFNIAKDFFQGFINGAKEAIKSVIDVFKNIGAQIVKFFKGLWDFITDENGNIEWGKLFAGGAVVSMLLILKQLATAFSSIVNILNRTVNLLAGVTNALNSFSKVLNGIAWDLKAKALLKMAAAIAILVAAIWVLTKIDDPNKLWQAVGIIVILAAILVGLAIAMDKLASASIDLDAKSKKLNIKGLQNSIIQIGIALLLIAAAVKLIGDMKPEEAERGFKAVAGIAVAMVAFIAIISKVTKKSGENIDKVGSMMKKLAIAMLLMVVVCKLAGSLSAEQMLKGAAFAAGFAIFVRAITKVAKTSGNNVSKVGGMVLKLAIAMAIMVGVCKLAGNLSAEEMLKGAAFAAGFVIFVKYLVKSTKIGKKQQIAKLSGLILSISFSLMLLVGVCKLAGMLSIGEMIKGAAFVAAFVLLLKNLMSILTISNQQQMAKVAGVILAMSISIAILAGIAVLLSFMDIGGLAKGIIAVGLLSAMMTIMVRSLKGAQNAKGAIMMMAIAIGIMAASIAALSFIDTKSLATAAGAMTAVMAAFALMLKSLKGIKNVKIGSLVVLMGVILILAGIVLILGEMDSKTAISSAVSLSILMLAMAGVIAILSLIGKKAYKALAGVGVLAVLGLVLIEFILVLSSMNGLKNAKNNVETLVTLVGACTLLLGILTIIGAFGPLAIIGVFSLAALGLILREFIWVLSKMNGLKNAMSNTMLLITFMEIMSDVLVKIAKVALLASIGVIAMDGLTLLMGAIGVMAVAVGALMDKCPKLQKFLDAGLPILEQLAGSIGTMIGKFIGGIGSGISSNLVKMGEDLSNFMDKLSTVSEKASDIKEYSYNGVKNLMSVLSDIGKNSIGTSISDIFSSILSGESSMDKFVSDATSFFNGMKQISKATSDVELDQESFDSIIGAAQSLADLQGSLSPIGGVISWFAGRTDLEAFGDTIVPFIRSMKMAFNTLDGVTLDQDAFNSIIDASTALAKLQDSIEPIGGVISWFKGRDDLGTFGENVAEFIESMKMAFSTLDGVTLNRESFNSIIDASTALAKLQDSIEPIGGVISWFKGRDDLGTFGENVAEFIESMKTALQTLDGVTLNSEALDSIVLATEKLSELQSSLEPMGGVISWFKGRSDLGKFGENVKPFAEGMKILGECSIIDQGVLKSIVSASITLSELQSNLDRVGGVVDFFAGRQNLETFGNGVNAFGVGMKALSECGTINKTSIESMVSASSILSELQSNLNRVGGVVDFFAGRQDLETFGNGVKAFATGMKKLSEIGVLNPEAVKSLISASSELAELENSLTPVGGVVDWFVGRKDLATFGENIASFMTSMKTAFSTLDGMSLDENAFSSVNDMATDLSELQDKLDPVGGVIEWFVGRKDLATFGENVATFTTSMKKAFSAIDGMTLDEDAFEALKTATSKLNDLQSELTPVGGVIEWFAGRSDLGTFGENVESFADGMLKLEECDGLSYLQISTLINSARMLKDFQTELDDGGTVGGLINWFKGKKTDLESFGAGVESFATGMLKLQQCEGLKYDNIETLTSAAESIKEFQDSLTTNVDGLLGYFIDKSSELELFGDGVDSFATGMIKLSECKALDPDVIATLTAAGESLKDFQKDVLEDEVDGFIGYFKTNSAELGEFGDNVGKFADAMTKLKTGLGESGISEDAITSITSAGTAIVELQKILPEENWFDGKMDLSEFSDYITDFGTAMESLSKKATEIDFSKISTVISTAYRIKSLITSLKNLDTSGVEKFTGIGTGGFGADGPAYDIARAIVKFSETVDDTNTNEVNAAISTAQRLKSLISSLVGLNTSGVNVFKTAINQLSTVNISEFVKAFSGASDKLSSAGANMINGLIKGMQSKMAAVTAISNRIITSASKTIISKASTFANAGRNLTTKLATGITNNKSSVSSAVSFCISSAVIKIRNNYGSFYSAGSYLVTGFANGISENTYRAAAKARAMAQAAENAAREALDINSPSKVFKKIGSGIPEGFAMGINMLSGNVKRSVIGMASTAIVSSRKTMSTILDALNTDMDAKPTIRPVIDLTDVKSGANIINGLFNGTQTIGLQSNLNAINAAMNRKLQNGVNDDVVSAINKLNDGLENNRGDTYNFGDFTYGNDSEVADAVKVLIRAAKMGRRV